MRNVSLLVNLTQPNIVKMGRISRVRSFEGLYRGEVRTLEGSMIDLPPNWFENVVNLLCTSMMVDGMDGMISYTCVNIGQVVAMRGFRALAVSGARLPILGRVANRGPSPRCPCSFVRPRALNTEAPKPKPPPAPTKKPATVRP